METMDYSLLSDEELLALEKKLKNEATRYNTMQMAQKILLNSLYGALGATSFRYYDLDLAVSVTSSGRHAIKWIERKLNELVDKKVGVSKDRVVLIDTDSVVIDLSDFIEKNCPKDSTREQRLTYLDMFAERILSPYIEHSYQELHEYMNSFEQRMRMKRENIINAMVSVASKAYVMEVYNSEGVQYTLKDPKMKIMGLQLVKSSMPQVVRSVLRNALPIMLHGTESDIQEYVSEFTNKYKNYSVAEIAVPRGVNDISKFRTETVKAKIKKLTERGSSLTDEEQTEKMRLYNVLENEHPIYTKGTPIHVKGSLVYNDLIDKFGLRQQRKRIVDGDKIKFVYLKKYNPFHEECIAFQGDLPPEFGLDNFIDYDKMIEKTFYSAMEIMVKPLGWDIHKKFNLDDFFNYG